MSRLGDLAGLTLYAALNVLEFLRCAAGSPPALLAWAALALALWLS